MPTFSPLRRALIAAVVTAPLAWPAAASDDLAGNFDVIYVPTPSEVVQLMLETAKVGPDDFVIDLGSGDGRIPIMAAEKFGARALGVDLEKKLLEESRQNALNAGVTDRVEFREQDLFETDIGKATVLTLYLLPELNLRLRPTILRTMAPGSRIVSHQFDMHDWPYDERINIEWRVVYLWYVPAPVEGRWRVEAPDGAFEIALTQEFQKISGEATVDGRELPLLEANLRGTEIRFAISAEPGKRQVFAGRVNGDAMQVAPADDPPSADMVAEWRATRL